MPSTPFHCINIFLISLPTFCRCPLLLQLDSSTSVTHIATASSLAGRDYSTVIDLSFFVYVLLHLQLYTLSTPLTHSVKRDPKCAWYSHACICKIISTCPIDTISGRIPSRSSEDITHPCLYLHVCKYRHAPLIFHFHHREWVMAVHRKNALLNLCKDQKYPAYGSVLLSRPRTLKATIQLCKK